MIDVYNSENKCDENYFLITLSCFQVIQVRVQLWRATIFFYMTINIFNDIYLPSLKAGGYGYLNSEPNIKYIHIQLTQFMALPKY